VEEPERLGEGSGHPVHHHDVQRVLPDQLI
jgi:hypothetical protein